jgi:hypothetical protein
MLHWCTTQQNILVRRLWASLVTLFIRWLWRTEIQLFPRVHHNSFSWLFPLYHSCGHNAFLFFNATFFACISHSRIALSVRLFSKIWTDSASYVYNVSLFWPGPLLGHSATAHDTPPPKSCRKRFHSPRRRAVPPWDPVPAYWGGSQSRKQDPAACRILSVPTSSTGVSRRAVSWTFGHQDRDRMNEF